MAQLDKFDSLQSWPIPLECRCPVPESYGDTVQYWDEEWEGIEIPLLKVNVHVVQRALNTQVVVIGEPLNMIARTGQTTVPLK